MSAPSKAMPKAGYKNADVDPEAQDREIAEAIQAVESDVSESSDTSSSENEDEDEEEEKDTDYQDKRGNGGDKRDGGGDPSSSSVALSSINLEDFDPEFFDAKLEKLNDATSIQALIQEYKDKATVIMQFVTKAKKKITIVKKLETKRLKEEKRFNEVEFAVNITFADKTFVMMATKQTTIKDVREYLITQLKVKKGDRKNITIRHRGETVEHGRKTLGGLGAADGTVLTATMSLKGGGKTSRTIKTTAMLKTSMEEKNLFENAFLCAVQAHTTTAIDFDKEIVKLSTDELNKLKTYLQKDKTKKTLKLEKLIEFLPQYAAMSAAQKRMDTSILAYKEMLLSNIDEKFTGENGEVSMDDILASVNQAIGKQKGMSNSEMVD